MKKITVSVLMVMSLLSLTAQKTIPDSTNLNNIFRNTLYTSKIGQAQVGGYAQIDYNQEFDGETQNNGKLDVHRLIMFLGHKFSDKTSFFTEVEFEHVKEVYVEQAFLEHKINDWMNFRAGLLLVPMSIINEYHEPPTFNGVERPNLNKHITPTTWRELGAGFSGTLRSASINYQAYLMNGFKSYSDGSGLLRGKDGLRKGRQKGAESFSSGNPNFAGKVNYYGVSNINIGLSLYSGKTQSDLFSGLNKSNDVARKQADSSVIGINMIELDYRYKKRAFTSRGELIYSAMSNTDQYNDFTGQDLGSSMFGFYGEVAYNLLSNMKDVNDQLHVFTRYEQYFTHNSTAGNLAVNKAYNRNDIVAGLHYKPSDRASFKADIQFTNNQDTPDKYVRILNLGVGAWF